MSLDGVAWAVVALFGAAAIAHRRRPRFARGAAVAGWVGFAGFWAALLPVFARQVHSPVETGGAAIAVGACLLVAWRVATRGPPVLYRLTTGVAVAGTVYLAAGTLDPVRSLLVETVAAHTHAVTTGLGYDAVLGENPATGDRAMLTFVTDGHQYRTVLVFACTGIGAIAVFTGVVAAVDAPRHRKASALVGVTALLWGLNLARNAFIAVAFGRQWLQIGVPQVLSVTGYRDPGLVSYVVADRLIAQPLSVVAIIGVAAVTARALPELYPTTRRLVAAIGGDRPSPSASPAHGGTDR